MRVDRYTHEPPEGSWFVLPEDDQDIYFLVDYLSRRPEFIDDWHVVNQAGAPHGIVMNKNVMDEILKYLVLLP